MKLTLVLGGGVLLAGLATACLASGEPAAATTVPEILQAQHALRAVLDTPNGEYSRFDEAAIHSMEAAQDRIFALLSGVTSTDQLNAQQRAELSTALQQINATLLAQDGNRMVCHVERKTGTHLTERRCETVASRNKNVDESRAFMADHPHHYYGGH